jgi:hypothetical protein
MPLGKAGANHCSGNAGRVRAGAVEPQCPSLQEREQRIKMTGMGALTSAQRYWGS